MNALQHTAAALALRPATAPTAVLMRHAARGEFAPGWHGNTAPITPQGAQDAAAMGAAFQQRRIQLWYSPLRRCVQTAECIGAQNRHPAPSAAWSALRGDAYVESLRAARATLDRLIHERDFYTGFITRLSQTAARPPYPHFRAPLTATVDLMHALLPRDAAHIHIGVTHDWVLNVAAYHATATVAAKYHHADFLDALFVWKADGKIFYYHQGRRGLCPPPFQSAAL